ncbi:MAG: phospholipase, partial [Acinetobacter sp.]
MGLTSLKLSAGVALLVGGFATQNALADSYVFVTNTTPQTVSLQINQTGTHILQQGNEWAQEATQIAPYETKRVLRINRYTGLKSGKTYNFDTVVSTGNSQVTLKQTMTGTWSGSTIKHGIQTATTTSPWYSDRDVHRINTNYAGLSAQAAVKAEYTGGYDDFHYTIHQNTVQEPVSSNANEL